MCVHQFHIKVFESASAFNSRYNEQCSSFVHLIVLHSNTAEIKAYLKKTQRVEDNAVPTMSKISGFTIFVGTFGTYNVA